jgi:translocation and assembly module TamB
MSTPEPATEGAKASAPPRRSLRARSRWRGTGIALTDVALIALPFLFVYWLLATAGGLRAIAAAAQWGVPALQSVEVESGSLWSAPRLSEVIYDDGSLRVDVKALSIDWTLSALVGRRLDLAHLSAAEVRIATTSSTEPPIAPASLALPLALKARIDIARIVLADYAEPAVDGIVLRDVKAGIESDSVTHRLSDLALTTPWGALSGAVTLVGGAPFALSGELAFTAPDYAATVALGGTLADGASADLHAEGFGLAGQAQIAARPFAAQPLTALKLALDEFDPQRLDAAAPAGRWTVDADLQARDGAALTLTGPLRARNREPGRIDLNRVPVSTLSAQVEASLTQVDLRELLIELAGGGEVRGEAGWRADGDLPVHAALVLRGIDTAALHGRGVATKLDGRVDVSASGERQQFELALTDRGPRRIATRSARCGGAAAADAGARAGVGARRGIDAGRHGEARRHAGFQPRRPRCASSIRRLSPACRRPACRRSLRRQRSGETADRCPRRAGVRAEHPDGRSRCPARSRDASRARRGCPTSTSRSTGPATGSPRAVPSAARPAARRTRWTGRWTHARLGALRALTGLELAGRVSGSGRLAGTLAAPHGS